MKIGLLACSTETGLGRQTYEFFKFMKPEKVLVYDIQRWNGMPTNHSKFPGARVVEGFPTNEDCEWLVDEMDVVFVCETPLNYHLFYYANKTGVKTVQQFNPEFIDYFRNPQLPKPTLLGDPTIWHLEEVQKMNFAKTEWLPVPINDSHNKRKIDECKTFFHIIGRPAIYDRNGTIPFLEAAKILGSKYKYKIYLQPPIEPMAIQYFQPVKEAINAFKRDFKLEVIENVVDYRDLYKDGDVLVLPRKYGGLCLPMQEALSFGVPVVMTDMIPNRQLLPEAWLCKAEKESEFEFHAKVDVYKPDIVDLAFKMSQFGSPEFMQEANKKAIKISKQHSWENLKEYFYTTRFLTL